LLSQSFLIREAYKHSRHMQPVTTAARAARLDLELVFVTDEIPLPGDDGKIVCDLLALRRDEAGRQVPVVIELKSERALTRLLSQVEGYACLVDLHADLFAQLFAALLGEPVTFGGPCEKVIVWPSLPGEGPEPRAAELTARGVVVVGYTRSSPPTSLPPTNDLAHGAVRSPHPPAHLPRGGGGSSRTPCISSLFPPSPPLSAEDGEGLGGGLRTAPWARPDELLLELGPVRLRVRKGFDLDLLRS
jgi:hypothetical protein